jgi:FKBP-type peptidyl-prolyl cis-trans isomerase FklB
MKYRSLAIAGLVAAGSVCMAGEQPDIAS